MPHLQYIQDAIDNGILNKKLAQVNQNAQEYLLFMQKQAAAGSHLDFENLSPFQQTMDGIGVPYPYTLYQQKWEN